MIEKGGEEEKAQTEGVQLETDSEGRGKESDGRATAETRKEKETETKAEREKRGLRTGSKGGAREAEKGLMGTEGGSGQVHQSHLKVQGLIVIVAWSKKKRRRKNRKR